MRRMIARGVSGRAAVRAQWTDAGLAAFEQFNYGSINGGLGVDPGAVTGDSGVAVDINIDGPAIPAGPSLAVRPVVRASAAQAWTDGPSLERDPRAGSVAIGAQIEWGDAARLDVMWAEPLEGIGRIAPETSGSRLYVQLSARGYRPRGALFGRKAGVSR